MDAFADFELWIASAAEAGGAVASYPVRVIASPAGPALGKLRLDLGAGTFSADLALVRGIDPDLPLRRTFGATLFEALFADDVGLVWRESQGRVKAGQAAGLRLRLWFDDPALAALPWELLYDPRDKTFLATAANMVLSRYLPVPEPPLLPAHDRLRILLVVESPAGVPQITAAEVASLEAAIGTLGAKVEHLTLRNPTPGEIQNALQTNYHVLHYLGHGGARQLVLTGAGGQPERIGDEAFSMLFRGRRTLRLIVLTACASSQPEAGGLFTGIGPALVQAQVPSVVAMQYPTVQMETAGQFSRAFYGALANGIAVDAAVNEARQAISAGPLVDGRDWSTPVLYMGTRSGRILNFESAEKTDVDRAWDTLRASAEESAHAQQALSELVQRFEQVATEHRRLDARSELARHLDDLETDYASVARIVEQARGHGPNLRLADLRAEWRALADRHIAPLQSFLEAHPEIDAAWFEALRTRADTVEADLAREALNPLANTTVTAFGSELAQADARMRQQLHRAVADLVALSERTLGRLKTA